MALGRSRGKVAKKTEKQGKTVKFSQELQRNICDGKIAIDEVYDALRTLSIFSEMASSGFLPRGLKADSVLGGTQILIDCLAQRAKVASEALWTPFLSCNVQEPDEGVGA